MRVSLVSKLVAAQVLVLVAVVAAIWLSFDFLASDYFMQLMKKFPETDTEEVNAMFLAANQHSLLLVGGIALAVSTLVGWILARHILAPLRAMNRSTERIAVGEYDCAVATRTKDELADLAESFNRMARSLAHNEQVRKSMIVDVAHELRTPLGNLRGFIEALQDGVVEPTPHVLGILHDELLRLVRLSEGLLQAARDGVRKERPRVRVRPIALLRETMELYRPRFTRRGIDIRADLGGEEAEVLAEPDQLKQVFSNLLQNCLQYAPPETWVSVGATTENGRLRLAFSNPGERIDPQELPLIFEPYYRVDKSRNRHTGGAGIGLAIVQSLVEDHGGAVGATSDADATSVWIELPRAAG